MGFHSEDFYDIRLVRESEQRRRATRLMSPLDRLTGVYNCRIRQRSQPRRDIAAQHYDPLRFKRRGFRLGTRVATKMIVIAEHRE